jgi:hypothetical protein
MLNKKQKEKINFDRELSRKKSENDNLLLNSHQFGAREKEVASKVGDIL